MGEHLKMARHDGTLERTGRRHASYKEFPYIDSSWAHNG